MIKNGALLSTPFVTITVDSVGERGLLGLAFDPNFASNQFVYVYYTATTPAIHNRISRFTANGDVAVAGSEVVIFDLDNLSNSTNHNGGALAFGPDGKLYAGAGENANAALAQTFTTVLGKMLRLNPDGSIPTDNPFYNTATGKNRAIWAYGLRNPFTFAFHAGVNQIFINDVGQNAWEEINDGVAGANYGWPTTEGTTTDSRFVSPRYAYDHGAGCAITGGAFYAPQLPQFPSDYLHDYFFADYCSGWIKKLDLTTNQVVTFATGIFTPVDVKVGDDGALYYLARGSGSVYRVTYGASAPSITQHPANRTVAPGASATFSVRASGQGTLRYQWQRNGANISGATAQDYTIASVSAADSGTRFRAVVTNDFGNVISNEAVLTVSGNQAPTGVISTPAAGTMYSGGMVINYSGTGTDPEDGTLPPSAFTWQVDFHHDTHSHPFIAATSGSRTGSFTIPTSGETAANVWYRIYLTVRDAGGLAHTIQRDIQPNKVRLTLATNPAGLQVRLDGQPTTTPFSFDAVVGIVRNLDAPVTQSSGATSYEFVSWSDSGAATHNISTPAANTTYTATYRVVGGTGNGLSAVYYDNADFTGATVTRVDPTVDFNWAMGAPATGLGVDTFSVRWTGQVEPPVSGTYTFYTQSDDGVRLWVNGQQIINNWTDHGSTENSGTIAMTAGLRYDIRMEFYEGGGNALARLSWSSGTSVPKAVVPSSRLFPAAAPPPPPSVVRVNFQPAAAAVPAGYLVDAGLAYGARGGGQTYGWNVDISALTRDRDSATSPDQRYDTLAHMQRPESPDAVWELAVPNGTYDVHVVSGDAGFTDSVYRMTVEGVLVVNGTPTSGAPWVEGTSTITVTDGRLTIRSGSGATNNKICFVEVTPR